VSLAGSCAGATEAFLAGFYLYPYAIRHTAERLGADYPAYLDEWLRMLTAKGFNLFYVTADEPDTWVRLSEKYRFKLIFQLDFAYLTQPAAAEVAAKAPLAIRFIKAYKDHPNVLAFSVREEPEPAYMPLLEDYYSRIKAAVPDAVLQLTHNRRDTSAWSMKVSPQISASDRYAFWGWDPSAGGYAATPASALRWFRAELDHYSTDARRAGAQFQAVFTTAVQLELTSEDAVRRGDLGDPERVLALARTGNQGWSRLSGSRLAYTKYYRPPPNCTRAMVWLAILEGARSILHWNGDPTDPAQLARGEYSMQMLGPSNRGSYMLDEYAQSVEELQRYGWILNRMQPDTDQSGAGVSGDNAYARLFAVPGAAGRILLVVNTDVGTWPSNSVPSLVGRSDFFPIDALGNLQGYTSRTSARALHVHTTLRGVFTDLRDGRTFGRDATINVRPGEGVLLFIGDADGLARLEKSSGLKPDQHAAADLS
jgi:hypothetical protein